MRYAVAFWVEVGAFVILTTAFHSHLWSGQWWSFLVGSFALGMGAGLIAGEKKP